MALTTGRRGSYGNSLAPQVGFEPTTLRLTAECSTVELLRSNAGQISSILHHPACRFKLLPTRRSQSRAQLPE